MFTFIFIFIQFNIHFWKFLHFFPITEKYFLPRSFLKDNCVLPGNEGSWMTTSPRKSLWIFMTEKFLMLIFMLDPFVFSSIRRWEHLAAGNMWLPLCKAQHLNPKWTLPFVTQGSVFFKNSLTIANTLLRTCYGLGSVLGSGDSLSSHGADIQAWGM